MNTFIFIGFFLSIRLYLINVMKLKCYNQDLQTKLLQILFIDSDFVYFALVTLNIVRKLKFLYLRDKLVFF